MRAINMKISVFLQRAAFLLLLVGGVISLSGTVFGQTTETLRSEIEKRNSLILELEKEIKGYESRLNALDKEAKTLQNTVGQIELTEKKLQTDIRLTEQRIAAASRNITTLTGEIEDKNAGIEKNSAAISEIVRRVHELESETLVEILLREDSFSVFWDTVESLGQLQANVHKTVKELQTLKVSLEEKRTLRTKEKEEHVSLAERLVDQKELETANRKSKLALLKETKNQESNYKKILSEKQALKEALEREIRDFESQIQLEIDPNSLPQIGALLRWPVDNVSITQYFGNTPFASQNPQVYNGGGHNGIDLRAPNGTIIRAAANGVVTDTGDTDRACDGASYGKWVLIRHYNNLSTLYAHLSLIRAEPGQEVKIGDVIGYSGNTGYSTGPHLHFTVYAASAVRVTDEYRSKVCGTYLKLPLSPRNGYLNPLSYLPGIR
ncbi:MAG: peptidoglycan DD-metalloendopeptidase family protein [Parcubacteria group bacterium]|nr:peptidoglycan DD-metalloendopeptidase family protein [Parcubacteria group bacterium]